MAGKTRLFHWATMIRKILFLAPTGQLGGAERCLVDALWSFQNDHPEIQKVLITGSDGKLVQAAKNEKTKVLAPFAITESLMSHTAKDSIFMHCLPAHRGEEVESSVIDGAKSVIWREAFHRRTTIQALLYHLTRGELKGRN